MKTILAALAAAACLTVPATAATVLPLGFTARTDFGHSHLDPEYLAADLWAGSSVELNVEAPGSDPFLLNGLTISGYLDGIMVSGPTPSPLPPRDAPEFENFDNDAYKAWLHAGGPQVHPFFRIEMFRADQIVQTLNLMGDSFVHAGISMPTLDGSSGLAQVSLSLRTLTFTPGLLVDKLRLSFSMPADYITHSFFDAQGHRMGPNQYSCYYGCRGEFQLHALSISVPVTPTPGGTGIAPVPLPPSALLLASVLAVLGAAHHVRPDNRAARLAQAA